jgi:hypothetical protein
MDKKKWVEANAFGLNTAYREDQQWRVFAFGLVVIGSTCYTAYRAVRGIVGLIKK